MFLFTLIENGIIVFKLKKVQLSSLLVEAPSNKLIHIEKNVSNLNNIRCNENELSTGTVRGAEV